MDKQITTAKEFNETSKAGDYGYELRQQEGIWKLFARDGSVELWSPDETMAALRASEFLKLVRE